MIFDRIFALFSKDLAIDLGTANSLVYIKGAGVVLREPSVVAIRKDSRSLLKAGAEAHLMVGKTPGNINVVRPLKDGVIADFDMTEIMLRHFIVKAHNGRGFVRPRVIIGVPSGVTEVEKRAVVDAALQAGAREAYVIEESLAAAIGAGLSVFMPSGNMIVDIGGGTTEIAVISLGGIVISRSIRIAGDEMDDAIMQYAKRVHNVIIGLATAENVKKTIGSALCSDPEMSMKIKGRDMVTGLPKAVQVSSGEIEQALQGPLAEIIEGVKQTLEKTPPELAADIIDKGIILSGGGSLIEGTDLILQEITGISVTRAEDPLTCVVRGAGVALEDFRKYKRLLTSSSRVG
ncbi:MAG: rod shape-determining protein [Firmicutes bacterium]|nr:rod shape-determining protein [Bacillota bacterium]